MADVAVRSDDTLPRDVAMAFARFDLRSPATPAVEVGATSATGTRREENQDAWGRRRGTTFVVADGMGGRPAGALAASTAVAVVLDHLAARTTIDWDRCMSAANQAVITAGERIGEEGLGTTMTILRCVGLRVTVAHLGDTRAYRLRGGRAEQLTTDHNARTELVAAGLDPERAGATARQLKGLTGYLGDARAWRRYEARSMLARPGDRFALTTDGVHDWVGADGWTAAATGTCQQAADGLVARAVEGGSHDDVTAIVLELHQETAIGGTP